MNGLSVRFTLATPDGLSAWDVSAWETPSQLSVRLRSVTGMTMKRSDFGSLGDRLGRAPRALDDQRARHVWLDSAVPSLVVDRRKTAGRWKGQVVRVEDGELLVGWVSGDRISTIEL